MAERISAEELEAVLFSLASQEGEVSGGPEPKASGPAQSSMPARGKGIPKVARAMPYERYDFRRPDKFSKEQIRTLRDINETFARVTASNFSALVRAPIQVHLTSIEQIPFEEYLKGIGASVLAIVSLAPLPGQAVIEVDFQMAFCLIDRMLGGPGRTMSRTSLTEIERPLAGQLFDACLSSLIAAWEPLLTLEPRMETIETSAQFVQIGPPTDVVLTALFEVRVNDFHGVMSVCIPYLALKPISSKLSGQRWVGMSSRKKSADQRTLLVEHLTRTRIPCTVRLGTATLTMRELIQLEPGDIVRLDQKQNDELLVHINGRPKFKARPIRCGQTIAVQVNEKYST